VLVHVEWPTREQASADRILAEHFYRTSRPVRAASVIALADYRNSSTVAACNDFQPSSHATSEGEMP